MDFTTLFGADKILLEDIDKLQSNTPDIIIWAAPVMFFFVLIEYIISYYQNRKFYEKKETFGSIWVGIGNVVIGAALKLVIFTILVWVYNLIPWRMELNWWTFLPCYILFDLCMPGFILGALYILFSWYQGRKSNDNINHDAHLYGALFGLIFCIVVAPSSIGNFFEQIQTWRLFD